MLDTIRAMTIIGCLALPLVLFAAGETPADAQENKASQKKVNADQKLAKKIRKSVAKDNSLQPSSRNIEVSVENGVVTLKGLVQSDEESQAIQGRAESLLIQQTPDQLVTDSSFRNQIHNELVVAEH
jgi:hypothetical protein